MMKRLALALVLWIAACVPALALSCAPVPNVFTPNTLIQSSQVNANFNATTNCVNSTGAANGANSDITSLSGLTTPLSPVQGGTAYFVGGTSTGSANAQAVASTTPNSFTLTGGNTVFFVAGFTNTGAATLNTNATGAVSVVKYSTGGLVPLAANDIVAGQGYWATVLAGQYQLVNPSTAGNLTGPASSTNGDVPSFNGTGGNLLQDSGIANIAATSPQLQVSQVNSGGVTNEKVVNNATAASTAARLDLVTGTANASSSFAQLDGASPGLSITIGAGDTGGITIDSSASAASTLALKSGTGGLTFNGGALNKAGTANTLNPYATSTAQTQAHGLGTTPTMVVCYLQNLTTQFGYAVGERVSLPNALNSQNGLTGSSFNVSYDGTNTYAVTGSAAPFITNKTGFTISQITPADWELVCTPYVLH